MSRQSDRGRTVEGWHEAHLVATPHGEGPASDRLTNALLPLCCGSDDGFEKYLVVDDCRRGYEPEPPGHPG